MLGFLRALIPGAQANAGSSTQRLFGFPSTPNYGGQQSAGTSGGFGGLLGFPSTPAYVDASQPDPEPDPDPECTPENNNNNNNNRNPSDPTR